MKWLVICLFWQSGPVTRTDFIAPVSVTYDVEQAVKHEELLKAGAWVHIKFQF